LLVEEGGSYSPDATHEAVEAILDAARRLRALIEKFLRFADLEALLAAWGSSSTICSSLRA
jgi:hypothetical protein